MDQDLQNRIQIIEEKVDKIYLSVEKTRKYLLWTAVVTIALFVLPLIGVIFVAPKFLTTYTQSINDSAGLLQ